MAPLAHQTRPTGPETVTVSVLKLQLQQSHAGRATQRSRPHIPTSASAMGTPTDPSHLQRHSEVRHRFPAARRPAAAAASAICLPAAALPPLHPVPAAPGPHRCPHRQGQPQQPQLGPGAVGEAEAGGLQAERTNGTLQTVQALFASASCAPAIA